MVGVDPGGPLITAAQAHASACCPEVTPVPVACLLPRCCETADDFPFPFSDGVPPGCGFGSGQVLHLQEAEVSVPFESIPGAKAKLHGGNVARSSRRV